MFHKYVEFFSNKLYTYSDILVNFLRILSTKLTKYHKLEIAKFGKLFFVCFKTLRIFRDVTKLGHFWVSYFGKKYLKYF